MATRALAGQAQTVLGPIAGDAMGITLPHEHLLIDFEVMFREPATGAERGLSQQPVSLANLGWVRHHFSSNLDNLQLLDETVARDEALLFKHAGGQTFVDPTNRGLARDPLALARVARATGLNIIMGSGYYVAAAHPPGMDARTVDDIARELVTDLTVGVDGTGVRAGFIGEIGTTWPWTDNEKKVVRAAVAAQRETGAALMIHPGRHERLPLAIVDFIRKEGADLERTIMCHIERTIADRGVLLELAATGVRLEYDLFGLETSYYPYNPAFDMPNDGERMRQILFLIERGHLAQILMSHDIAYKHCLTKWGGFGYHHLLVNVIPRLRDRGADDRTIQTLLVDNPRRAFTYA
ncbi:MAG TPA: aryldialkylphosphatase [Methylomirabilota bacterium]|nr:aryldialkylphosphatase [Methylomirabilota bacterium]